MMATSDSSLLVFFLSAGAWQCVGGARGGGGGGYLFLTTAKKSWFIFLLVFHATCCSALFFLILWFSACNFCTSPNTTRSCANYELRRQPNVFCNLHKKTSRKYQLFSSNLFLYALAKCSLFMYSLKIVQNLFIIKRFSWNSDFSKAVSSSTKKYLFQLQE